MVVVEPLVSEEKLRQLLAEQAESASLDFKSDCDLRQKADQVELAKDVGAMQMHGGFIVLGADDRGQPAPGLNADRAVLFDEARLRAKLRRWLAEPLEILSARHEVDGHAVVLVYIGASPLGFAIFQADGQYDRDGKSVTAFRKGDVFARHGSASEPWSHSDLSPVFERVVGARKDEWRRGLAAEFARLGESPEAHRLAVAPASAMTWNLDAASFAAALVEQLRAGDDIPWRLLLERIPAEAAALARSDQLRVDLGTLFDRLMCSAAIGLRLGRPEIADLAIETAGSVYDIGFDIARTPNDWAVTAPSYWLQLLERVLGLGALAVRLRRWDAVRALALRRGDGDDWRHWRSWVRHGLTMAARFKLFDEEVSGRQVERSLLSLAHRVTAEQDCLRADLRADDERLLDSLCQFDALTALAIIAETRGISTSDFYPSFARFYTNRTEPIFVRLLSDQDLRQEIFPLPDDDLAAALRGLSQLAGREAVRFAGWGGFTDAGILRFLEEHPEVA